VLTCRRRRAKTKSNPVYYVAITEPSPGVFTSTATPTILTGNNTQNPGDIEVVSVPYPPSIPVTGGFFRVIVSMH